MSVASQGLCPVPACDHICWSRHYTLARGCCCSSLEQLQSALDSMVPLSQPTLQLPDGACIRCTAWTNLLSSIFCGAHYIKNCVLPWVYMQRKAPGFLIFFTSWLTWLQKKDFCWRSGGGCGVGTVIQNVSLKALAYHDKLKAGNNFGKQSWCIFFVESIIMTAWGLVVQKGTAFTC